VYYHFGFIGMALKFLCTPVAYETCTISDIAQTKQFPGFSRSEMNSLELPNAVRKKPIHVPRCLAIYSLIIHLHHAFFFRPKWARNFIRSLPYFLKNSSFLHPDN